MPVTLLETLRKRPSGGNGRTPRAGHEPAAAPTFLLSLVLTLACALAVSLAFPGANATPFAFVGLAPLFWLWSKSSWKAAFWWGLLGGAVMYTSALHWITDSLWYIIGDWFVLGMVLGALIEGAFVGVIALITSAMCRGRIGACAVFAIPAIWLLLDTSRSYFLPQLPFGELGVVAVHVPFLLPLAAFAGIAGLTAIVALVNGAALGIVAGDRRARIAGVAALGAVALVIAAGDFARSRIVIPAPTVRVAVAQGDISQRVKWSPAVFAQTMSTYSDLTASAARAGAKIVVWPETAITSFPLQDRRLMLHLQALAAASKVWLIAGTLSAPAPRTIYNSVIDIGPTGGFYGEYDKHILVPFAEYLPLDTLLRKLPLFNQASWFDAGPGPRILSAGDVRFGPLICFESAFLYYVRDTVNLGANALVIVTDDAWFDGSPGPQQHADFSRLDAVATGRWVVRGADTGISQLIDPAGRVVNMLPMDRSGVMLGDIGAPLETAYDRYGDDWLFVLATLAAVLGIVKLRERAFRWRSRRAI